MLARYRIVRGARPVDEPLPHGVRQDTRKHTRHVLAPRAEMVARFLATPDEAGFRRFRVAYLQLLEDRFSDDRSRFDEMVALARETDVYLGCNCPTSKQPLVERCHTYLALGFLQRKYPDVVVANAP